MMLNKELQKVKHLEDPMAHVPKQYHKYNLYKDRLNEGLPPHSEWDHEIVLKEGASPKYHKIYNLSEMELKTLKEWIEVQLQKGYIRILKSPIGHPIIFVPKKNGKLRLVINYRELNKITIKDKTPLPLISQIKNRLHGKKWFTTLDLTGAYKLTRMKEGHK
jgi:hypothetical protein